MIEEKDSDRKAKKLINGSEGGSGSLTGSLQDDMAYLNRVLDVEKNFDIIYRVIQMGGKEACMYLVDGFCKDDLVQKLLQYFMDLTPDEMPKDIHGLSKGFTPYVEVDIEDKWDTLITSLLSGIFVLLVDGYEKALLIDSRTYPARSVGEPEKDKTLRAPRTASWRPLCPIQP